MSRLAKVLGNFEAASAFAQKKINNALTYYKRKKTFAKGVIYSDRHCVVVVRPPHKRTLWESSRSLPNGKGHFLNLPYTVFIINYGRVAGTLCFNSLYVGFSHTPVTRLTHEIAGTPALTNTDSLLKVCMGNAWIPARLDLWALVADVIGQYWQSRFDRVLPWQDKMPLYEKGESIKQLMLG